VAVTYEWRGPFENPEVNALHAEGFGHAVLDDDWRTQIERHSLGWVCAREGNDLVGFVNVAWDGAIHAFVLDTVVASRSRRRGIGTELVARAVDEARKAGCEWIHVDFDNDLASFYFESCGFVPTKAGVIAL
jgi:ribosomal protein S18 acetylase RimI-like enzyme